jgi:hypothetical protein
MPRFEIKNSKQLIGPTTDPPGINMELNAVFLPVCCRYRGGGGSGGGGVGVGSDSVSFVKMAGNTSAHRVGFPTYLPISKPTN